MCCVFWFVLVCLLDLIGCCGLLCLTFVCVVSGVCFYGFGGGFDVWVSLLV